MRLSTALMASLLTGVANGIIAGNTTSSGAQATFVSPLEDVLFGLNIPSDASSSTSTSNEDVYFSLGIPVGVGWGAIGLGGASMSSNALVLMIYPSTSESNSVTFSPRLATAHTEPEPYSGLEIDVLASGLTSDGAYLIFSARCANCRKWLAGSDDSKIECMYATGRNGNKDLDHVDAPLKMHANYGSFTLDLRAASGSAGAPVLPVSLGVDDLARADKGTTQGLDKRRRTDLLAVMHAVFMVGVFFVLFPFGVVVLRLGSWTRWHAANQVLGVVCIIVGAGLGIADSMRYNRSKKFTSGHQIIGLAVFALVFIQAFLGVFHHRVYKRTQQPTKIAPYHVWGGRVIMMLGILNGFLGFPFALTPTLDYVLAGIAIAIIPPSLAIIFFKRKWNKLKRMGSDENDQYHGHQPKTSGESYGGGAPAGYDPEPWRRDPAYAHAYEVPPAYGASLRDIQLGTVGHGDGHGRAEYA